MQIAIIHNPPVDNRPDSEDVIRQLEFVSGLLSETGHDPFPVPFTGGVNGVISLVNRISTLNPPVVFNLVESIDDEPRRHPAAAALFDVMNISYTGSPYEALLITTDKLLTKALLRFSGISTPDWFTYDEPSDIPHVTLPCIVKPVWEDASIGIHDSSVFHDKKLFASGLRTMARSYGSLLIERYVAGREFNVSLLEDENGKAEVMPPAEIIFRNWPEDKPKIVNYDAKWDERSFEFHNTLRSFPSPDDPVVKAVSDIAFRCWELFGLRGYARVDIRVDEFEDVHVIEINANPCISPDAGFMAATAHASLPQGEVIERILNSAIRAAQHKIRQ